MVQTNSDVRRLSAGVLYFSLRSATALPGPAVPGGDRSTPGEYHHPGVYVLWQSAHLIYRPDQPDGAPGDILAPDTGLPFCAAELTWGQLAALTRGLELVHRALTANGWTGRRDGSRSALEALVTVLGTPALRALAHPSGRQAQTFRGPLLNLAPFTGLHSWHVWEGAWGLHYPLRDGDRRLFFPDLYPAAQEETTGHQEVTRVGQEEVTAGQEEVARQLRHFDTTAEPGQAP